MLWTRFPNLLDGLELSRDIYRNPEGTPQGQNEYIHVCDFAIAGFSAE
jgi:hypothetical protein